MDYAALRKHMVDEQLIGRGITNKKVLEVFYKVERHRFMPENIRPSSYADFPLPIGHEQTISQPYIVALMTESLNLRGGEKVLEIGTGSGYQTAILAEIAGLVYSIERFNEFKVNAEIILNDLGYKNIKLASGDGTLGWPEFAPYDRIIITAAAPKIPVPLVEQLKPGGRMILPLGENFGQVLTAVDKDETGQLKTENICGCVFVPLIGKYGWSQ